MVARRPRGETTLGAHARSRAQIDADRVIIERYFGMYVEVEGLAVAIIAQRMRLIDEEDPSELKGMIRQVMSQQRVSPELRALVELEMNRTLTDEETREYDELFANDYAAFMHQLIVRTWIDCMCMAYRRQGHEIELTELFLPFLSPSRVWPTLAHECGECERLSWYHLFSSRTNLQLTDSAALFTLFAVQLKDAILKDRVLCLPDGLEIGIDVEQYPNGYVLRPHKETE